MYLCISFFIGFINLRAFYNAMEIIFICKSLIFLKEMNTKWSNILGIPITLATVQHILCINVQFNLFYLFSQNQINNTRATRCPQSVNELCIVWHNDIINVLPCCHSRYSTCFNRVQCFPAKSSTYKENWGMFKIFQLLVYVKCLLLNILNKAYSLHLI